MFKLEMLSNDVFLSLVFEVCAKIISVLRCRSMGCGYIVNGDYLIDGVGVGIDVGDSDSDLCVSYDK